MSDGITAAAVGAAAPTLIAPLPYVNERAARRQTTEVATTSLTTTVGSLEQAAQRTKAGTGGLETDPRKRRQGRLDVRPLTRRTAAS